MGVPKINMGLETTPQLPKTQFYPFEIPDVTLFFNSGNPWPNLRNPMKTLVVNVYYRAPHKHKRLVIPSNKYFYF